MYVKKGSSGPSNLYADHELGESMDVINDVLGKQPSAESTEEEIDALKSGDAGSMFEILADKV